VPSDVRFATKPQLGVRMIERAIAAGVPFAWVAADTVYGVGAVEMALRKARKAMCWVSPQITRSIRGAASPLSAALPRTLRVG
jgi:SRSO17 transposase